MRSKSALSRFTTPAAQASSRRRIWRAAASCASAGGAHRANALRSRGSALRMAYGGRVGRRARLQEGRDCKKGATARRARPQEERDRKRGATARGARPQEGRDRKRGATARTARRKKTALRPAARGVTAESRERG